MKTTNSFIVRNYLKPVRACADLEVPQYLLLPWQLHQQIKYKAGDLTLGCSPLV